MTAITARVLRSSSSTMLRSVTPRSGFTVARLAAASNAQIQRRTYASDIGPGKPHATEKPGKDVQSDASRKGQAARANESNENSSSGATSGADIGDHNKRAKEDHPEAPGPVIGMNDERGGKGH